MTVPAPVYRRTYRRIRWHLVCASCGSMKSDATVARIRAGRSHARLCSACFKGTPAGRLREKVRREGRRARDRVRFARTALDAKTAAPVE